jgi:hypothetical protein
LKYHNFDKIGDILPDVMKQSGINVGISQIALFNLWNEVVGKRFLRTTKAIKLHGKTLTIATKSPAVTQELVMFKADIMKKLSILTKNLEIEVSDLVFNHKVWNEINKTHQKKEEFEYRKYLPAPKDGDIANIELPQNIKEEIEKSFENTANLTEEMKQKIIKTISDDIKRQIWKKERGYPLCQKCFIPLDYIDEGQEPLCPACKNVR